MASRLIETLRAGLPDRDLTPEDITAMFSVPIDTDYHWRKQRTGPPGFRVRRHIRYDPAAVRTRVQQQEATGTAA